MARTSLKSSEQFHEGPADPQPGEIVDGQEYANALASGSIAELPNLNTIERVRHDGGVSEATFDGNEWHSADESLRIWLNNSAKSGIKKALAIGCNPPGTEAKRLAEEAAKLAAPSAEAVAAPE